MNFPNLLTSFRIVLVPLFVVVFYLPFHISHTLSAIIFLIASLTDWLDGYLARCLKQISTLGTFLDPVADKLIIVTALVLLVSGKNLSYLAIPAIVIINREILVSALREWMAEIGRRVNVAVSLVGKIKTAAQMLALTLLLAYQPIYHSIWMLLIGYVLLYGATFLTLWSMCIYLKAAWNDLRA